MNDRAHKPLMRSLGEFVGHIVRAVRTDPRPRRGNHGEVILRRTTIEEIRLDRSQVPPFAPAGPREPAARREGET